jgi:DNA-binding CsgD family transcriptional regulator
MDRMEEGGELFAAAMAGSEPDALAAGLAGVMDELAHGVLVVEPDGSALHANQAARHELARRGIALDAKGGLAGLPAPDQRALADALSRAREGKRSLVNLRGTAAPALTVAVVPLKPERGGGAPRAAIVFSRPSVCESLMLCFFARTHGLTAAEEQVLTVLCQGYSAPEAARQLKVAVSTVRSHVRSLCAKTQSSGVRELVGRVAVLPPVAPVFQREPIH